MSGEHPVGRRPRVSDEEILDAVRRVDTPVATTAMVAEALPIGRRGVLNRLTDLHDAGRLESMNVGAHGKIWWIPTDAGTDDPASLKSFGKYEGTNIGESVDAVAERFDHDVRDRMDDLSG